jgi:hypothetical protein
MKRAKCVLLLILLAISMLASVATMRQVSAFHSIYDTGVAVIDVFNKDTSMYLGIPDAKSEDPTYMLWDGWGGTWCDAEKRPPDDGVGNPSGDPGARDDLLCWAAVTSNVLEWTGWGKVAGMTNCDQMFWYFQVHWSDDGGKGENGWHWWFDGTEPPSDGSSVEVAGGNFWPAYTFTDYWGEETDASKALEAIDNYLHSGSGVYLSVDGHAITCWGFSYDPSCPDYYTGIYVTDSDDYKGYSPPAPDMLRYYGVKYDGDNNDWCLQDYYGTSTSWIHRVEKLQRFPNQVPVADAGGPYYCSLGGTVLLDASASYDPDGYLFTYGIVKYEWDLNNDGIYEIVTGSPTYSYTWSGEMLPGTVTLRVTDLLGGTGTATTTITTYGVQLTLIPTSRDIVPGTWGTYDLTVKNLGNIADIILLSLTGLPATWEFTMPSSVMLDAFGSTTVQISIKPYKHCTTSPGDYPFTVTGASSAALISHGWNVFDTAAGNVHVLPYYAVDISITPASLTVKPGETATYTISVHNLGNVPDTFDITLTYHDFGALYEAFPTAIQSAWVTLANPTLTVNPCNTVTTTLTITVPPDWAGMEDATYTFDVTATSQTDATAHDTASSALQVEATKHSMVEYIKLEIQWLKNEVAASWVHPSFVRLGCFYLDQALREIDGGTGDGALADIERGWETQANVHLMCARTYIRRFYTLINSWRSLIGNPVLADKWQQKAMQIVDDIATAINTPI